MKFFVDTADIADITELADTGLLDGVTTNPSLIHKSGRSFLEVVAEICRIVRPGGSIVLVDLVQHKQEWMRQEMAHRWLGFNYKTIENLFRAAGAEAVDYELTGSYAGEKMLRNGNQAVEIFVARVSLKKISVPRKAKR